MQKRIGIAVLFVLLFAVSPGKGATELKEFKKTYPLNSGGEVTLSNVNGRVEIRSWDKNQVMVKAEIKVKAKSRRDAERYMKHVKIIVDADLDYVDIETNYPKKKGSDSFVGWLFGGRKPEVSIKFSLMVPHKTDLEIHTVNGRINVEDVEGKISLKTTNGAIEATDLRGAVKVNTVNGSVNVDLVEIHEDESLTLSTVNGSINLNLPSNVRANVNASCVNGHVDTDFPLTISGKYTGKKIRGEINGGGARLYLKTVNGSINLNER